MYKDYTALLSSKVWPRVESKLLANVKNPIMYNNLKIVLANTRQALLADTTMQNMIYLPKIVLPLVRRLFPKLIANQIISTQPLQSSTGWIRFLDAYVEGLDGNPVATDSPFGEGNIYPWSSGDYNYSTPQSEVHDTILADSTNNTKVNFNGTLSETPSEGTLVIEMADKPTLSGATSFTKVAEVDRNGVIHSLSSALTITGMVNMQTGVWVLNLNTSNVNALRFTYKKDIQKNIPFGSNKTYNTLKFNITKIPVEAKTRKLGATYSFELIEDYKNEFGENFEDKMVDYLTTTILTEIDGETINMLFSKAAESSTWDASIPMTWTRGVNAWYETIMPKINKLSNIIFQKTHVAGASFLLCSPTTATVFQSMIQYTGNGNPVDGSMEIGTVRMGTLSGQYNVYVSPLCEDGKILLGFKGSKPEETGAIYAPYVPIQLHPIYYSEGQPSIMARSRYWMGVLRPDYYAVLNVTGL